MTNYFNFVDFNSDTSIVRGLILKSTLSHWQYDASETTVLVKMRELMEAVYLPGGAEQPPDGQGTMTVLEERAKLIAGGATLRKKARALDDADEEAPTATWNVTAYTFYFNTVLNPANQIKALTPGELVERINKKIGSTAELRATKRAFFSQPGEV
ncbi:unnamed protein product, partial [Amoebophrya sp. A120]|eukprot:GSA120T00013398001.1